jgi:3-hydroxymyristoyl/3-hydroxydecanoyl-(acyl carrier protein) dehydratase
MRFLFVDRVLQINSGSVVRGIKHITADDYYLCQEDTDGFWCFIPSLMGETLGQLAAWQVMVSNDFTLRPVAGVVASARVHRPAYVGETLLLEATIDHLDDQSVQYHGVVKVHDEIVFSLDGALGPLLPMQDFISQELIRQQWQELNRPGDWPELVTSLVENNAPITHSAPMVFDRIISNELGVKIVAQKMVTRAAAYFPDHFPAKPVLPLTVLLECQMNLVRDWVKQSHFTAFSKIYELRKIKMNAFVYPGDIVTCTVSVKSLTEKELVLSCRCEVSKQRVCVLEVVLQG